MSETVHYRGTLTEVKRLENETLEEQCKRLLGDKAKTKLSYYDTYTDMLLDEHYKEYIFYNNVLYSLNKQEISNDEDIYHANKDENGIINFEVKYYNGGCGFQEAIEEALVNMDLKEGVIFC